MIGPFQLPAYSLRLGFVNSLLDEHESINAHAHLPSVTSVVVDDADDVR